MKIDEFFFEEEFHKKKKKEIKLKRKIKSKLDKSKYKKSNLKKESPNIDLSDLKKGRIISILGQNCIVLENKTEYICQLKGALKKTYTKDKNIIAVGDIVFFKKLENANIIHAIEKRFSILMRSDSSGKKKKIIATNIDQVLITTSILSPPLKPALIDRYLIAATKGALIPIIIINKIDLLNSTVFDKKEREEEKKKYLSFVKNYKKLNIPILSISCKTGKNLSALHRIMKEKTSCFSGQSGTGKTSLINKILKTKLKTKKVNLKTYKGTHTTEKAHLIALKGGGFCIDTPGVKSFGLWDITQKDIKDHFSEFHPFAKKCKYSNCNHLKEPGCMVKEALEKNKISAMRYESYKNLMEDTKR